MRVSSDGILGIVVALLVPIATAMIMMYSDVQGLKESKADRLEVNEVKAELGKQMALNTQAIQNLDTTLGKLTSYMEHIWIRGEGNGKQ